MAQVTEKHLRLQVKRLNKLKGFEEPAYSTPGAYDIDGAYGGVALHRYENEHGGVSDVFRSGHMSKKDLYNRIDAFIAGIESER